MEKKPALVPCGQRDIASLQPGAHSLFHHTDGDKSADALGTGLEAVARSDAKLIDDTGRLSGSELQPAQSTVTAYNYAAAS